jgi:preprotein translocase subunit SecD
MVAGDDLIDSRGTFQENNPVVSFRFNTAGAKKFGKATSENVQKLFAIVLDGDVISAPRINEPITGGSGIISGNFTAKSAEDLALLLRSGALPVPLMVIEERTVGPGLGADSIAAGTNAALISLVATVVFMIAVYGLFGGFATIAVVFNLVLMLAVMSVLGATLTLPGLAGIVLTIGMAVDANVLIYERIREEATLGRSVTAALETGFSRVLSTIVDANVTTLISALMLYTFGSGPVKGFAVTLAVGILTSMFTAVVLTRYMVVSWLHTTKPKKLPI